MRDINTKVGVFLTTYTKKEMDEQISIFNENKDIVSLDAFMGDLRSFNEKSEYCITEPEAEVLVGLEIKKNNKNPNNLYSNYNGNPFGLSINEARLYFKSPIQSLKSAFLATTPEFNFNKDFFLINVVK